MGVVLRFKWDAKYKTLSRIPDSLCVPGKSYLLLSFSMEEQNQQSGFLGFTRKSLCICWFFRSQWGHTLLLGLEKALLPWESFGEGWQEYGGSITEGTPPRVSGCFKSFLPEDDSQARQPCVPVREQSWALDIKQERWLCQGTHPA